MTSGHVATRYKVRFRAGHSWLHVKLRSISHLTSVGLWPGCRETNKKGGERWDWAGWSFNRASYNRRRPWSGQFAEERESKPLLERKEEQRGLNEEGVKKILWRRSETRVQDKNEDRIGREEEKKNVMTVKRLRCERDENICDWKRRTSGRGTGIVWLVGKQLKREEANMYVSTWDG